MRLTDRVSEFITTALADQTLPGEVIDHEVMMVITYRPGGEIPHIWLQFVGYDSAGDPLIPVSVDITGPCPSLSVIQGHVATALAWIRAQ
ncbi:hypothetical protein ACFYY8_33660 [Streptosporangium sp. NPDC001559]|uniref:hypothetical protein n=1 Tax=Streptosporangium sp. NPDC001559 TaxID=3366187 RepID=UPI0036E9FF1C